MSDKEGMDLNGEPITRNPIDAVKLTTALISKLEHWEMNRGRSMGSKDFIRAGLYNERKDEVKMILNEINAGWYDLMSTETTNEEQKADNNEAGKTTKDEQTMSTRA